MAHLKIKMWDSDGYESDGTWARLPEEDRPQFPALQRACFEGRADVVRQMLAAGADPESPDERGMPVLFYASGFMGVDTGKEDYVGVVEALLAAGADATVANQYGNTPLHYVEITRCKADRIAILLLNAGARPSNNCRGESPVSDPRPSTPYRDAICGFKAARRVAPILLRAGADMSYLKPPFNSTYLETIHTAGGFKAHEKQHADALVAIFAPKFPVLPPEMVRHIVFFWAHVGFY